MALRESLGCLQVLLQGQQARPDRSAKEAEIAHLHKAFGKDMLEKAMDELLCGEGTLLELSAVGSAVGEGDLGGLHAAAVEHADQAAIAQGHAVNIGCQIAQCSLSIAHRLAVHHPLLLPNFGRQLRKEGCLLQQALEGGAE